MGISWNLKSRLFSLSFCSFGSWKFWGELGVHSFWQQILSSSPCCCLLLRDFPKISKVSREKVFWGSGTLCDFRLRCPGAVQFVCSLGVRITSLLRNVVRIWQLCVQRDVCFWSRKRSTEATELSRCYASRWCHLISHLISSFKGIHTYEEFPLSSI